MEKLKLKNIRFEPVTLHVGAGTFLPVKTDNPDEHHMHSERYLIPSSTYDAIKQQQAKKQTIICVGTTSLRSLESFHHELNQTTLPVDRWLETKLFIYPKHREDTYRPNFIDGIITNFHQPESSLFMLICALIGFDKAHAIYREAIEAEYRFFSYGDACLFWL